MFCSSQYLVTYPTYHHPPSSIHTKLFPWCPVYLYGEDPWRRAGQSHWYIKCHIASQLKSFLAQLRSVKSSNMLVRFRHRGALSQWVFPSTCGPETCTLERWRVSWSLPQEVDVILHGKVHRVRALSNPTKLCHTIHAWLSTSQKYYCGRLTHYGHYRLGYWWILSCILRWFELYDTRMEAGTLSGRASRIGDKISPRTCERDLVHSRVTRMSDNPSIRRIPLLGLLHPILQNYHFTCVEYYALRCTDIYACHPRCWLVVRLLEGWTIKLKKYGFTCGIDGWIVLGIGR